MRGTLILNTPISTKMINRLLPSHWSRNALLQFIWLGGITTSYKTSWPSKQMPQLHLRFWRRQLSFFFEALGHEPTIIGIRDVGDLLDFLSQDHSQSAHHLLFHLESDMRRQWLLLEQIDSQLCLFDGQSSSRMSAQQLVNRVDALSLVLIPKSLFLDSSPADLTHASLRLQAQHLLNETGPLNEMSTWLTALRRPSLRLSWEHLLSEPRDYFWIAVQLGAQLRGFSGSDGFDGHRLAYANALVEAAALLKLPALRQIALDVRRSAEMWQIIQDIMLMGPSQALNETRMLLLSGASPHNPAFKALAAKFVAEGGIQDISFLLRGIENKLQSIKELESTLAQQLRSSVSYDLDATSQNSAAS